MWLRAHWHMTPRHFRASGGQNHFRRSSSPDARKGAMVFHMLRCRVRQTRHFWRPSKARSASTPTRRPTPGSRKSGRDRRVRNNSQPSLRSGLTVRRAALQKQVRALPARQQQGIQHHRGVHQDLDLFRTPVELRVETEGKTENKKIEVVGTDTKYIVDTFGLPAASASIPRTGCSNPRPPAGTDRHSEGAAAGCPGRLGRGPDGVQKGP